MSGAPAIVIALLFPLASLAGGFLVVYWAARLAIRHERTRLERE